MELKEIQTADIKISKEFILIFDTQNNSAPYVFYLYENNYFPVFNSFDVESLKSRNEKIKAIILKDKASCLNFILSLRGINNLTFVDKLYILNFIKSSQEYPLNLQSLRKYLPLLSLPETALNLLSTNRLSPDFGLKLLEIQKEDCIFLVNFINELTLNINQQKEFFEYIKERSKIENKSIKLITEELDSYLAAFPIEKRKELLFELIRAYLMPEYTKTLKSFNRAKDKLNLPKKVITSETPYFETKTFKIEIFAKSYEELNKSLNELKYNVDMKREVWEEIFKLI